MSTEEVGGWKSGKGDERMRENEAKGQKKKEQKS